MGGEVKYTPEKIQALRERWLPEKAEIPEEAERRQERWHRIHACLQYICKCRRRWKEQHPEVEPYAENALHYLKEAERENWDWTTYLEPLLFIDECPKSIKPFSGHVDLRGFPGVAFPGEGLDLQYCFLREVVFDFACFANANFGYANLGHCKFNGATLIAVTFSNANLEGAQFYGARLPGAKFNNAFLLVGDFKDALLTGSDLNEANLGGVSFEGALLTHSENLRTARVDQFTKFGVGNGNLIQEIMNPFLSFISSRISAPVIGDEQVAMRQRKPREKVESPISYNSAMVIYQQIKEAYKAIGERSIAGQFYYRERVCSRKQRFWESIAAFFQHKTSSLTVALIVGIILCYGSYFLISKNFHSLTWQWLLPLLSFIAPIFIERAGEWLFFDVLAGYGEHPLRVLGWAAVLIVACSLVYWFHPGAIVSSESIVLETPEGSQQVVSQKRELSNYIEAIYFSVVTFTTLGFGDFHPSVNNPHYLWMKIVVAGEALMGALLIALALVCYARIAIRD